jgi:hypothetical protein
MKTEEKKIKFGPGHFPIGTIARVQVMEEPYDFRVDRIFEQSAQGWILESDLNPSEVTGKRCINVGWVIGIVSRGTGHCNVVPYHEPVKFTQKRFEKQEPYAERCAAYGVGKNEYLFDDVISDIRSIVYHYPQYAHLGQQHLYDFNAIAGEVLRHARQQTWYAVIINKKKFHRVLKAALARFKESRAKCEKLYREEQQRWGDELMRDMYDHDDDMLDDEERKVLAEQHEQEENIFQNDGLDDAHFECMLGGEEPLHDTPEDLAESYNPHGESNTIVMDNTYMVRK